MTKQNIEKIHNITMILNQMDNLLTSFVAKAEKEKISDEELQTVLDKLPDFPEEILSTLSQWSLHTLVTALSLSGKVKDKE